MSGSDRGRRTTPLEALFCILALLGLVGIAYATGGAFGIHAGRNEVTARQHYDREKQNALSACADGEARAVMECVTKAIESAQEKSEARQDLYAQQDMAKWAFWMLIVSTATFGITAVGVWFVKGTLEATLVAVKGANDATAAMIKSNHIALNAQRAWVDIEADLLQFETVDSRRLVCSCSATFKNTGKIIAEEMSVKTRIFTEDRAAEWIDHYFEAFLNFPEPSTMDFIPGQTLTLPSRIDCVIDRMEWRQLSRARTDCHLVFLAMARYRVSGDPTWRYTLRSFLIGQFRDHVDNRTLSKETIHDITMDDLRLTPIGISRAN
jgi:hypothetical protein